MTSANSRLCIEQGNFGTQQLESYLEELGIDKQDMIDPPKEARALCDLSTPERRVRMEGFLGWSCSAPMHG